jgi:hypothetical protein
VSAYSYSSVLPGCDVKMSFAFASADPSTL